MIEYISVAIIIISCMIGIIVALTMTVEPEAYPQQPKQNPKPLTTIKKKPDAEGVTNNG